MSLNQAYLNRIEEELVLKVFHYFNLKYLKNIFCWRFNTFWWKIQINICMRSQFVWVTLVAKYMYKYIKADFYSSAISSLTFFTIVFLIFLKLYLMTHIHLFSPTVVIVLKANHCSNTWLYPIWVKRKIYLYMVYEGLFEPYWWDWWSK